MNSQDFLKEFNKLKRMAGSVKIRMASKKENVSTNAVLPSNTFELTRICKRERQEDLRKILVETMKFNKKARE